MEIIQKSDNGHNPKTLIVGAQSWLKVYQLICANPSNSELLYQSLYSFLFAIELYLKSYIVLKNHDYAGSSKLQSLGHNFSMMREAIVKTKDHELNSLIKEQCKNNKILDNKDWSSDLRYVPSRMMILLDRGIERGIHGWQPIFLHIESKVDEQFDQWKQDHYPVKKSHSLMLSIGAPTDKKTLNKISRDILKLCPDCRPESVSAVFRRVSYPWEVETEIVTCMLCKKEFILRETWFRDI